jgi:hypothetical protein
VRVSNQDPHHGQPRAAPTGRGRRCRRALATLEPVPERAAWATVREDYSSGGDAWSYFTHEQARSRAYRWGEDGIAGVSDDRQSLCLALALCNGHDPILKERVVRAHQRRG